MSEKPADQEQQTSCIETAFKFEVVKYLTQNRSQHHAHANSWLTRAEYSLIIRWKPDPYHGKN